MKIPLRYGYILVIISTALAIWGVLWVSWRMAAIATIVPTDDQAIQQDWIHLNEMSIVEDSIGRPYRWLVEQPKDAYKFLNTRITHSLAHTSAILGAQFGRPSFWIVQSVLQNDVPSIISIRGQTGAITGELSTDMRHYQWLVPYAFVPQQDHLIPLTNQTYTQYGFEASQTMSSTDDQRVRLARWYGTTYQRITSPISYGLTGVLLTIIWLVIGWGYRSHGRWYVVLSMATLGLWGIEWVQTGQLTLEPIMTLIVTSVSWHFGKWIIPQLPQRIHIPIFISAIGFQGVYAYATAYWMQGVDFAALSGWADFVAYIGQMRMAMPIPLLFIEYAIYWMHIPGIWSIGYLALIVRTGMIVGVVWALAPWLRGTIRQQVGASIIMIGLLIGSAFVFRYDDRNVWMVYDALFAAPFIWIWRMLQRTEWKAVTLLGLGFAIVWLDALRPFMVPFTPLVVGIVAWRVWQQSGRQALWYVLAPLVISIGWHAYHITVLGQMSWSSHTGFNIARAWLPDLAMQTMAQQLPDMNSSDYLALSNTLVSQSIAWIINNPWLAVQQGITLIGAMIVVPVEMSRLNDGGIYNVIVRDIPWYVYGYRLIMIIGIIRQCIIVVRHIQQRQWGVAWWNAVIVLAIVLLSAVTEYGEQARFIAALAAMLWLVEDTHTPSTHLPNTQGSNV